MQIRCSQSNRCAFRVPANYFLLKPRFSPLGGCPTCGSKLNVVEDGEDTPVTHSKLLLRSTDEGVAGSIVSITGGE